MWWIAALSRAIAAGSSTTRWGGAVPDREAWLAERSPPTARNWNVTPASLPTRAGPCLALYFIEPDRLIELRRRLRGPPGPSDEDDFGERHRHPHVAAVADEFAHRPVHRPDDETVLDGSPERAAPLGDLLKGGLL